MVGENVELAFHGVSETELWARPNGAPSLGFHLGHLAGSTDRLLTYARGERLSGEQLAALARETTASEPPPSVADLLMVWRATLARALEQLASTSEASLLQARMVGRAQLPSTVLGLLFHAAEHAQRHAGQITTTARIVRGDTPREAR
jgi:uncharacterized damage-inducible protein DinB